MLRARHGTVGLPTVPCRQHVTSVGRHKAHLPSAMRPLQVPFQGAQTHSAHLLDSKQLTEARVIFAISRLSSHMILTPIRRNHTQKVETTKSEIYEHADSAMKAFLSPHQLQQSVCLCNLAVIDRQLMDCRLLSWVRPSSQPGAVWVPSDSRQQFARAVQRTVVTIYSALPVLPGRTACLLNMNALHSFETSGRTYPATRRHIPEHTLMNYPQL
jgi:hypothetical protein